MISLSSSTWSTCSNGKNLRSLNISSCYQLILKRIFLLTSPLVLCSLVKKIESHHVHWNTDKAKVQQGRFTTKG